MKVHKRKSIVALNVECHLPFWKLFGEKVLFVVKLLRLQLDTLQRATSTIWDFDQSTNVLHQSLHQSTNVNNEDAGKSHVITAECLDRMMYECFIHQAMVIAGGANKMAY